MTSYRKRTKEQISFNMSRIRGKDTKPELVLRKALLKHGLRYQLYYSLPGKPDIVLPRFKLAVFCDGEFWHGRDFEKLKMELKRNRPFWIKKITDNVKRDKKINLQLRKMGWKVLRFWNKDIRKNTGKCVQKITDHLSRKI
jgi:DNA mismatch endonuclease, patch repair protein